MEVNNNLFSSGGRIGRIQYLVHSILLTILSVAVSLAQEALFLNVLKMELGWNALTCLFGTLMFLNIAFVIYLSTCIAFKRLRDIQGKEVNTALWVFLILFPFTNVFVSLYLQFCPGFFTKKLVQ